MPISPPIEVPNQSTAPSSELAVTRATRVTMSLTYWGIWYSSGLRSLPERPRPTTSGHTTR